MGIGLVDWSLSVLYWHICMYCMYMGSLCWRITDPAYSPSDNPGHNGHTDTNTDETCINYLGWVVL